MRTHQKNNLETLKQHALEKWGSKALTTLSSLASKTAIPTGFRDLDLALGTNGLPVGTAIELLGQPTSGMATLALHMVAASQKAGKYIAYFDLKHALDPVYAEKLNVSLAELLIVRPTSLTQALDIGVDLLNSTAVGVIVLDRLSPQQKPSNMQLQRLSGVLARSNTVLIILSSSTIESPQGLVSSASIRLHITHQDWIRHGTDIQGYEVQVNVLHNKFAPPAPLFTLTLTQDTTNTEVSS